MRCVWCGDLHKQLPSLMYTVGTPKPKSPNSVDDWLIFTVEISRANNFFFGK